jgi:cytochrome P450
MQTHEAVAKSSALPVEFNPFAPELERDPHAVHARLRAEAPVAWCAPFQAWFVTPHALVRDLLVDPRLTSNRSEWELFTPPAPGDTSFSSWFRSEPINRGSGEEGWRRVRRIASKAFTPRAIARMESHVRTIVAERIGALRARLDAGDEVDLVPEFAARVPLQAIGRVLGVTPDADEERWFRDHASVVLRVANPLLTPEQVAVIDAAAEPFMRFLREHIARCRRAPGDDFVSGLVRAEDDDGSVLDDEALVALILVLLLAGTETTGAVLATAPYRLARHPEERARFLAGEVPEANAIEELVRLDPPGHFLMRVAREPMTIGGQAVRRGQMVLLSTMAANRDPAVFHAPDRIDLGRDVSQVLSFGLGPHYCLGAALARLELRIGIGELTRAFPDLVGLEPDLTWVYEIVMRKPAGVRVARAGRAAIARA